MHAEPARSGAARPAHARSGRVRGDAPARPVDQRGRAGGDRADRRHHPRHQAARAVRRREGLSREAARRDRGPAADQEPARDAGSSRWSCAGRRSRSSSASTSSTRTSTTRGSRCCSGWRARPSTATTTPGEHTQRVGRTSALVARRLDLGAEDVTLIEHAATLHDIGKIAIPDHVLLKPGRLTDEEFELMKTHVRAGAEMLAHSRSPLLQVAERIALTHHEWWDGSGYLSGLRGDEIPAARSHRRDRGRLRRAHARPSVQARDAARDGRGGDPLPARPAVRPARGGRVRRAPARGAARPGRASTPRSVPACRARRGRVPRRARDR